MKITEVRTYSIRGRHWPRFPWAVVEVTTSDGTMGIGEALLYRSSSVLESIEILGKKILGEDPFNVEKIWEGMYREGANLPAVSGIEIALWDIIGKKLGAPIYNLLGGKCRDKIRVYVDGFFRGATYVEEEYIKKALEAVKQGYGALKMDVDEPIPSARQLDRGISPRDLEYTVKMVKAVREAVGREVELAIDCHGAFDVNTAVKIGRRLEEYDLLWIEDPIPLGNPVAMAKVSQAIQTPICTGELLNTRFEFRELLERQAADIIMPDVARTGGILEMKKIAAVADMYYVPLAPHNMVGPIATIATAHICACISNFLVMEFQLGDIPWRDRLLDTPVPIKDGYIELPTKPGLGVSLNMSEVEKHLA